MFGDDRVDRSLWAELTAEDHEPVYLDIRRFKSNLFVLTGERSSTSGTSQTRDRQVRMKSSRFSLETYSLALLVKLPLQHREHFR